MSQLSILQAKCIEELKRCFHTAKEKYELNGWEFEDIKISFSNSLTRAAGNLKYKHKGIEIYKNSLRITLSNKILALNEDVFIKDTPGHEMAHAIVLMLHGNDPRIKPHGYEWRQVMRTFGIDPKRTHDMKVPLRKDSVYAYCGCESPLVISKMIAGRIKRGGSFKCKQCKHILSLNKNNSTEKQLPQPEPKKSKVNTKSKKSKATKADGIRNILIDAKQNGATLDILLSKAPAIKVTVGLKSVSLTKTYIKNNWKKLGFK